MPVINIEGCIKNSCGLLEITDLTGPYVEALNPNGWTNALLTDLVRATVLIHYNGELLSTHDVLSNIPIPMNVPSYTLLSTSYNFQDGQYLITFEVEDSLGAVITKQISFFSVCNVRCCVDKLWSKASKEEPDCNCSATSAYTKLALQAEGLLGVIKNSASCINTEARDKILKKLQRICKFEKCNC